MSPAAENDSLERAGSDRGFALIELMVALGVAGILLAVVTQLFFQNSRANRSVELSTEFNQLVATVGLALTHPASCTAMLANKEFDPDRIPSAPSPSSRPINASPLSLQGGPIATTAQAMNGIVLRTIAFDRILHDLGLQASGRHGYLVNLVLKAQKSATNPGGVLPGTSELEANFTVPVFINPATQIIQGCADL